MREDPNFPSTQTQGVLVDKSDLPTHLLTEPHFKPCSLLILRFLPLPSVPLPEGRPLQGVRVPLLDSHACDRLYHLGANVPQGERIVLPGNLCAGYRRGHKDACQVCLLIIHIIWNQFPRLLPL